MRITRPGKQRGWHVLVILALVTLVHVSLIAQAGASTSEEANPGGIGVRLLDVPADAATDPRAQLYVVDHLSPGSVITRRIEVTNSTGEPVTVFLYAAGATIDDSRFVGLAGHTANELSSWCSVVPTTAALPAGGSERVVVKITVPNDAPAGERYAAVWAEVRTDGEGGIQQVNRVGIRLYVSVGPGAPPAADFEIESLTAQRSADGMPAVLATVHNTGGRALDMAGSLELLNGPGELQAGPFPATLGSTLAIGSSGQVMIILDERLPDGPWDAELILRSGLLERSAKASITFPASGSAPPVSATPAGLRWLFPTIAGLTILLLVIFIIALAMRRRRRKELSHTQST